MTTTSLPHESTGLHWMIEPHVEQEWHGMRLFVAKIVKTELFNIVMVFLVLANLVYVIIEADSIAKRGEQSWQVIVSCIFVLCYLCELFARIYVDRMAYFRDVLNQLDFITIFVDFVTQTIIVFFSNQPSVVWLRLLRVMRMLRIIRRFDGFRELWLMLHGLVSAVKAMIWACILIMFVLMVWSLVAVETLKPLYDTLIDGEEFTKCDMCPNPFGTVTGAAFTWFLLIMTGTRWFEIVVPMVEVYPWTSIVFMSAFVTINLGLLNLVLTVIVDRAAVARMEDEASQVEMKKLSFEKARRKLLKLCGEMDDDNSGCLTLEELEQGFEQNQDFAATMKVMDVAANDLKTVFNILDEDKSGTVTYEEFVEHLHRMKTQETHMMLVFIKHYVAEVREKVGEQLALLKSELLQKGAEQSAMTTQLLGCLGDAACVDMTPTQPTSESPEQIGKRRGWSSVRFHLSKGRLTADPSEKAVLSPPPERLSKDELETQTLLQPCLSDVERLTPGQTPLHGKHGRTVQDLQHLSERLNQAVAVFANDSAAQQARIAEFLATIEECFSSLVKDPASLQREAPLGNKYLVPVFEAVSVIEGGHGHASSRDGFHSSV